MSKKRKRAKPHFWTEEQVNFIKEHIKGTPYEKMRQMVNDEFGLSLTPGQIKRVISRNGLRNGRDGTFQKNHKTWNKGMKGLNTGGEKGWFKKGHKPYNYLPVGSERIDTEGYTVVKVADPNIWKPKHRIIWEEHYGDIPDDHAVIFGDGNKRNFDIDNLMLVSKRKLAILNKNKLIKNDADLTRVGLKIAEINIKMNERKESLQER